MKYLCPRTNVSWHTPIFVSSHLCELAQVYLCPHIYVSWHTAIFVSSHLYELAYSYICVLAPRPIHVSAYCYVFSNDYICVLRLVCVRILVYLSSYCYTRYCYICMCPHTTIYVSSCVQKDLRRRMLTYVDVCIRRRMLTYADVTYADVRPTNVESNQAPAYGAVC
jgi:hypothetical protein